MSATLDFYRNLPEITDFHHIFQKAIYQPVPEDWYVVVTDVKGSTKAIEAGKYKDVNIAGGIASVAICNIYKDMDFPFIFGGDGITFLIPPDVKEQVKDVLADTREFVRLNFALTLRVGLMQVAEIYQNGEEVNLAKLRVSEYYNQATVAGQGLDWAEEYIKSDAPNNPYLVPTDHQPSYRADFSGFYCRWNDIPSHRGETLALIIKTRLQGTEAQNRLLAEITDKLEALWGGDISQYHPLSEATLTLTKKAAYLRREALINAKSTKGLKYLLYWLRAIGEQIGSWLIIDAKLIPFKVHAKNGVVQELRQMQIKASDFRKFDGTLKMILACTTKEAEQIRQVLEPYYEKGQLFFGIHRTDKALMTCVLNEGSGREVHFIDAADGGYAMAAKEMKGQVREAKLAGKAE